MEFAHGVFVGLDVFHYLTFLSEADLIKQLLYDLPDPEQDQGLETGLGITGVVEIDLRNLGLDESPHTPA